MAETITIKRGYDVPFAGAPVKFVEDAGLPDTVALKPTDFKGIRPKLTVQVGDEVKAGSPLFFDKFNEAVKFTAPLSGEVVEINRGAKRVILEVKILVDKEQRYETFEVEDPRSMEPDAVREVMFKAGVWPMLRERPFDKIAQPTKEPKAIFISGFDTNPLAIDYNYALEGQARAFQTGINALRKLTSGKVHLNLPADETLCDAYRQAEGVEKTYFQGPHPSGNIGIQIHHISPINKGDLYWYINPQDVVILGRLFLSGHYDARKYISVGGNGVRTKSYHQSVLGTAVAPFLHENLEEEHVRIISGSVLFGSPVGKDGYLGFYDNYLAVIPEGDEPELFGWLLPSYPRPSLSKTFPWAWQSKVEFEPNTNTHGEERPFVVSGEYEKVLPMDIYPVYLLKAILANDVEAMEGLGIYEVSEEDFALCEFACTSKQPVTDIIRQGIELMERET